jgi:hypothetical protein
VDVQQLGTIIRTTEMQTDQFDTFVEDFLNEKLERSIVIVGASRIDDLLLLILTKYLVAPLDAKKDELLEGDRPLSTFSSRIKSVYRFGIIDKSFYKILDQVRNVRNLCAHKVEFNIKVSPVRDHLLELKKGLIQRETYSLTMKRYFGNKIENNIEELRCIFITICVILEAIYMKVTKTSGISETLNISKK